jgi:hypothetical protein
MDHLVVVHWHFAVAENDSYLGIYTESQGPDERLHRRRLPLTGGDEDDDDHG